MLVQGCTYLQIVRALYISPRTISTWSHELQADGVALPRQPGPLTCRDQGIEMLRNGLSVPEVARRLNVARRTVQRWKGMAKLTTPIVRKRTGRPPKTYSGSTMPRITRSGNVTVHRLLD